MMKLMLPIFALSCFPQTVASAGDRPKPVLVDVQRIWDKAPHNGFTDLIRFNDRWYCTFREGEGHVSNDGVLKVIVSEDGNKWESVATFTSLRGFDMREAKFSITPDGRLMLTGAEANRKTTPAQHQSLVWFSKDGENWSDQTAVADPDFWLWRGDWHNGTAYFFGYGCREDNRFLRLYTSTDGKRFDTLVDKVEVEGTYPNETSLVFLPDDTCYCLLRHDGEPKPGCIGKSHPPYTEWNWKSLGIRIGGPDMIRLPDGRFVAVVRRYAESHQATRTFLYWLDPEKGTLEEALELPSAGDTSYAGLVWHDDLLWISYYSTHEEKTNVYLAKVRFENEEKN
jgi:hypothetical protein